MRISHLLLAALIGSHSAVALPARPSRAVSLVLLHAGATVSLKLPFWVERAKQLAKLEEKTAAVTPVQTDADAAMTAREKAKAALEAAEAAELEADELTAAALALKRQAEAMRGLEEQLPEEVQLPPEPPELPELALQAPPEPITAQAPPEPIAQQAQQAPPQPTPPEPPPEPPQPVSQQEPPPLDPKQQLEPNEVTSDIGIIFEGLPENETPPQIRIQSDGSNVTVIGLEEDIAEEVKEAVMALRNVMMEDLDDKQSMDDIIEEAVSTRASNPYLNPCPCHSAAHA